MLIEIYVFSSISALLLMDESLAAPYTLTLQTKPGEYSGTSDDVYMIIEGTDGKTKPFQLTGANGQSDNSFHTDTTNWYDISQLNVGIVCGITLILGDKDGWLIGMVVVTNRNTSQSMAFPVNIEIDDKANTSKKFPVNGKWSRWGDWSRCNAACATRSNQRRTRSCNAPKPGCGGKQCGGELQNTKDCEGPPCTTTTTTTTTMSTTTLAIRDISTNVSRSYEERENVNTHGLQKFIFICVVFAISVIINIALAVLVFFKLKTAKVARCERQRNCRPGSWGEGQQNEATYVNKTMLKAAEQ